MLLYLQFNFVGRLLGPRGNSLKRVEVSTDCRVLIRGRGSIKDPAKVIIMLPEIAFVGMAFISILYFSLFARSGKLAGWVCGENISGLAEQYVQKICNICMGIFNIWK